ncbi:hypothetical protein [Paracoccus ravus]|uniref:hypothetical protein n=1 Tax=Paracoccus ravus TaxID=2447760 RepID=UPI00106EC067|nr:hypothetical protein [Paracoccus ravus]
MHRVEENGGLAIAPKQSGKFRHIAHPQDAQLSVVQDHPAARMIARQERDTFGCPRFDHAGLPDPLRR